MYECNSIYRYGRVELNLFISEKEYTVRAGHFTGNEGVVLHRTQSHLYCRLNVFAGEFFFCQNFYNLSVSYLFALCSDSTIKKHSVVT